MAVQTRNTLKSWFKRGLKPLEAQFADWIDSFWHKNDKIPADSVEGMQDLLDLKADMENLERSDEAIGDLQDRATDLERKETGQYLPVDAIIGGDTEPEYLNCELAPVLTAAYAAGSNDAGRVAAISTIYNESTTAEGKAGTIALIGGIAGTTSSKPTGKTYGLKLESGKAIEFTELNGGAVKNLRVDYYAGGSNRFMNILLDGAVLANFALASSGHQTFVLEEVGAGVLRIEHGGGSSFNLWDVQFDVEVTPPVELPETAEDGYRVIKVNYGVDENGEPLEDKLFEWRGGAEGGWKEQDAPDGIEVRAKSDNYHSYVKELGHFALKETDLAPVIEMIEGLEGTIGTVGTDATAAIAAEKARAMAAEAGKQNVLPRYVIARDITNFPVYPTTTNVTIQAYNIDNNTGNWGSSNIIIPAVSNSAAGVMTPDKNIKLDGIAAGAQVNEVTAASLAETLTGYLTEEETLSAIAESEVGLFNDKGSVATRADLPEEAADFDFYFIEDEEIDVYARNIAGNLVWKTLAPQTDLTDYETVSGATEKANAARDAAVSTASADATTKANAAKQAAIDAIPTMPTETSQFTNDGADGVHPYITAEDLPEPPAANGGKLGFSDITSEIEVGADGIQNVAWDWRNGNLKINTWEWGESIITEANIEIDPEGLSAGDVRYLVIEREESQQSLVWRLYINGKEWNALRYTDSEWKASNDSILYNLSTSGDAYDVFKFTYLGGDMKFVEVREYLKE